MANKITLRTAHPPDKPGVDRLLAQSYPRLLAPDYAPQVLAACLPIIATARSELLASGRYYVAMDGDGAIVGAGGYSLSAPTRRDAPAGDVEQGLGHIRHVATDPDRVRLGIGSQIMSRIFSDAMAEGVKRFECLSTVTAVPFYAAHGFVVLGPTEVAFASGAVFPAVRLEREM